ncbi:hypothetical protein [Flavobacterium sp. ZB4R12]|uniref:hypothetical protein n=1 Tax=Flavobacterium sp. ZB4R12 TaxID=3398732 RepID=UPI003AAA5055
MKLFKVKIFNYITKTVWILALVSLFTDMASEMLYPIMPIYLKSIGFSIVLIGVLVGFAATFITTAIMTLLVIIYFTFFIKDKII